MATTHDVLTGSVAGAHFVHLVDQACGAGGPVAVAVADLDDFAGVNDAFGRDAGDRVLARWEATLRASLPGDAVVARLGGDEFAVALPDTTAETALILMDEVRSHFAGHRVPGVDRNLEASVGIAARPPHATDTHEVMRAAHEALMRAKREGRGRVAIYVEEKMTLKSNYYSRAALDRLAKLSAAADRTEASLLREALDDLFTKHRDRF